QDLSVVRSVSATKNNTVYETKTDKFSSVLSKAADDPGLLKVPVAKKEEPKPKPEEKKEVTIAKSEETKPVVDIPKDTVAAKPAETVQTSTEKKEEPVKTEPAGVTSTNSEEPKKPGVNADDLSNTRLIEYKRSSVIRRSESSTTEGFGVVFHDKMEDKTDTIRILIPPSKIKIDEEAPAVSLSEVEKKAANTVSGSDPGTAEVKLDQPQSNTNDKKETERKNTLPSSVPVGNTSACKEAASEKDFMKLRKNMAAEETDEAMIDEAKKVFKNKCFTVEQLRYLSTLFLTSAAKYQFFDASFNHISDKQNFASLQSEIKDEYYLKRFKALAEE
ncbi:MAG TPA: DUF4476 domain-containing protein, partial [Flavisolibacter sp.]|nr:DUF4476 domain-containing protein [Flavisolibacter sp.]